MLQRELRTMGTHLEVRGNHSHSSPFSSSRVKFLVVLEKLMRESESKSSGLLGKGARLVAIVSYPSEVEGRKII